jgi:hypothetical protein
VVDDRAFVDSVIENAARWYDENVSLNAAMRLTARLLGSNGVDFA